MRDHWIVLRTAGKSTLVLASTLADDGFDVWTPVRKQRIRVPRMNVKRDVTIPLLPSFVFARADRLAELLELSQMRQKSRSDPNGGVRSRPAHRDFSVFRYLDEIPVIEDRHLEPMRTKEREAAHKRDAPRFECGAKVRVGSGAFEGLRGKVQRCKSGYALVIFTDWKRPVNIPTFLLREDQAFSAQSVAKAA